MKVVKLFDEVFRWLPLAAIIDNKVLVVHGGVSEHIDLNFIETIDRQKYVSVLRPPIVVELEQSEGHMVDARELEEWKQ
ncbi:serine/threonine-protein phosphatase, partial [Elysia marginata]